MKPRRPEDFLRIVNGVTERKCLGCGQWLPEAEHFAKAKRHGKPARDSRCKPCNKAYRVAHAWAKAAEPEPDAAAPVPREPPALTWGQVLRGWLT